MSEYRSYIGRMGDDMLSCLPHDPLFLDVVMQMMEKVRMDEYEKEIILDNIKADRYRNLWNDLYLYMGVGRPLTIVYKGERKSPHIWWKEACKMYKMTIVNDEELIEVLDI